MVLLPSWTDIIFDIGLSNYWKTDRRTPNRHEKGIGKDIIYCDGQIESHHVRQGIIFVR